LVYWEISLESQIILAAENKEALNKLIDDKLKEGYLLKGGMYEGEESQLNQLMIQPNNIDGEVTKKGAVKMVIGIIVYAAILYFVL